MPTRIEEAALAIVAALELSSVTGDLPTIRRNSVALTGTDRLSRHLGVFDGDTRILATEVSDDGSRYELAHTMVLELVVEGAAGPLREATLDAMRMTLRDQVLTDRTLGGRVDDVLVTPPSREDLVMIDGLECTQERITLDLVFTAPSPLG